MNFIRLQQDYDDPRSLASRFRRARMRLVVELIRTTFAEKGSCRILDLGGRPEYWRMIDRQVLEDCKVTVTTLNTEPQDTVDDPMFEQRVGDACALDAADDAFDLAHSNSVIEHVGDWARMEQFAAETRRVAPRYFVQTPYFWFPIEPHLSAPFVHWAPAPMQARWLIKRGHAFVARTDDMASAMRAVQDARLLDKAMMRHLFPDARLEEEKVAGLTKSLMAIRA
ncbi:MAG TPA: methyltransferase domain-containing protein [Caulobacteraceae bacterium]|nr:methyltransferase domain-containing protein [Caulobacteraceae bacterium]